MLDLENCMASTRYCLFHTNPRISHRHLYMIINFHYFTNYNAGQHKEMDKPDTVITAAHRRWQAAVTVEESAELRLHIGIAGIAYS